VNFIMLRLYLLLICTFSSTILAEDISAYTVKEYPGVDMTELTLRNGMKVILKPTDDDSEMTINISAAGGFASLKPDGRASGEIAGCVVVESGIGDLSPDHLSTLLYDHSIEFNLKIGAFTRSIDATLPTDSLEAFCSIVHKIFVDPKFDVKAFNKVVSDCKRMLAHRGFDANCNILIDMMPFKEKQSLLPLQLKDLEKADLKKSRRFFQQSFANPADFICVIAGDFDKEKVKDVAVKYLGAIPKTDVSRKFILATSSPTKIVATKIQQLPGCPESLVRLAFPLQHKLDSTTLEHLELFCQVEENRLNNLSKNLEYGARGIDVWYEMPLYPALDNPWITIQFHTNNSSIKETIDLVLLELKKVQLQGFSQEEVDLAAQMKRQSLQLWQHDNGFWSVLLSNSYLWGWDPHDIEKKFNSKLTVKAEAISSTLRAAMPVNEYVLSTKL
jgi:zinc protease